MNQTISHLSGPQNLYVPGVEAFDTHTADGANPTVLPVKVALPAEGTDPVTWLTAAWAPWVTTSPYTVMYSLDPSSYTPGTYDVWVDVQGAAEQPSAKCGFIRIT